MKPNVYSRRKEAWEERKRQMLDAGLISDRFPDVSSIVVTMDYSRGTFSAVHRTMNFYPGSHAFFKISSLGEGSDEGGLDLTRFIHKMIGSRVKVGEGRLQRRPQRSGNCPSERRLRGCHHLLVRSRRTTVVPPAEKKGISRPLGLGSGLGASSRSRPPASPGAPTASSAAPSRRPSTSSRASASASSSAWSSSTSTRPCSLLTHVKDEIRDSAETGRPDFTTSPAAIAARRIDQFISVSVIAEDGRVLFASQPSDRGTP